MTVKDASLRVSFAGQLAQSTDDFRPGDGRRASRLPRRVIALTIPLVDVLQDNLNGDVVFRDGVEHQLQHGLKPVAHQAVPPAIGVYHGWAPLPAYALCEGSGRRHRARPPESRR